MDFSVLIRKLQEDQDYSVVEALEKELKTSLLQCFERGDLNTIVKITHALGLLLKYKSYGIKCCTLLGYSIFLLKKDEGFSFQQHLDFKTELFHFIEAPPGGYAFIAESAEIKKLSKKCSFESWFAGERRDYDPFKHRPRPGDVLKINKTGIVHTAIGCTLEEYANTSTDMVDRLYDQNKGRVVKFGQRKAVLERIKKLNIPQPKQEFVLLEGRLTSSRLRVARLTSGVTEYEMHCDHNFVARRIHLAKGATHRFNTGGSYASLFCSKGEVSLESSTTDIEHVRLHHAESVILPPGTSWIARVDLSSDLSVLYIDQEKAFL